ncbi:MAG: sulfatase-like hydrolase/transferase, partial [Verrucomicrobiota bacterium]
IYPYLGHEGKWNLTTAMADEAIQYMKQLSEIAPEKPFFVYYVPGGVHSPHHPTQEWIDKVSAMHLFDDGWDKLRDTIFANQKRLGIVPPNAELTPWPDALQHWNQLSWDEKKLFTKQADVFGAFLAYTDHEIGRVIDEVAKEGKLDKTLIIYISGDNGASAEGSTNGTPNEFTTFNGIVVPVKDQFLFYDVWGSDLTFPHYAVGWSWALDTPFKWVKQVASHFGGTRQGMCISWPGHITDVGGIRTQFSHVNDIVPTILDVTGIRAPDTINGIKQLPMDGTSLTYTWPRENANLATRHNTQYFEMLGNRAIYHDGWVAATTPVTIPWELSTKAPPDVITGYGWELYNIQNDFTENHDLAAQMPGKLKEMQALFYQQAAKFDVLPLDNSTLARFTTPRPSATAGRTTFTYSGELGGTPASCAPDILDRSYMIHAEITVPEGGAEGMIATEGGRFGGYGLFLSKGIEGIGRGHVVFLYNLLGLQRTVWEGPELAPGKHTITFDFEFNGPGLGKGGTGELMVDGNRVAVKTLEHTTPIMFPEDETFDVGLDTGTPVSLVEYHYDCPFKFNGTIDKLTFELAPKQLGLGDRKKAAKVGAEVNN